MFEEAFNDTFKKGLEVNFRKFISKLPGQFLLNSNTTKPEGGAIYSLPLFAEV